MPNVFQGYSDAACNIPVNCIASGSTIYFNGPFATDTSASTAHNVYIKNSASASVQTILTASSHNTFNTASVYHIKADVNGGVAPSWVADQSAGKYFAEWVISGSSFYTITASQKWFDITTNPTISYAGLVTNSIPLTGSTNITASVVGTVNELVAIFNNNHTVRMSQTTGTDYSGTVYGYNVGLVTSSVVEVVADSATIYTVTGGLTVTSPSLDKRNTLFNEIYTKLTAYTATGQIFDGLKMRRLVNPEDRVEANYVCCRMMETPPDVDGQYVYDGVVINVTIPIAKNKTITIGGSNYSGKQLATYYKEQLENIVETWFPGKITSVSIVRGPTIVREVLGDAYGEGNEQLFGCEIDVMFQWTR